eukprot:gene28905-35857_t
MSVALLLLLVERIAIVKDQRGLCPFEIRRYRLATSGREMQREVICPLGCIEKLRAMDVRFHIKFECTQRMVACRFDYCTVIFPLCERDKHEHTDCAVMVSRVGVLSEAALNNEESPCPLCSEPVKHRDMAHHGAKECEQRYVFCPNEGCTVKTVKAHRLEHHIKYECDSEDLLRRRILVVRARQRTRYARPWGISIEEDSVADGETVLETVQQDLVSPVD